MKIKHIIYTRFSNTSFGFDEEVLLDEERLKAKLDIFSKMTYPSIMNQTNKNFEWVVLIHDEIPTRIYEELKKMDLILVKNSEYQNLFTWTFENFNFDDVDFVITTRIDDDDLLHKNAIKQIQDSLNYSTLIKVIGFRNGSSLYDNQFFEMNPDYKNSGFIALGLSVAYNYKIYEKTNFSVLNLCGPHNNFRKSMENTYYEIAKKIKEIDLNYFDSDEFWKEITNEFPSYIYNRNDYSDSKRKAGENKFKAHFSDSKSDREKIKTNFDI